MAQVRHAAASGDPGRHRLDVGERLSRLGQLRDAERERFGLTVGGGRARGELARRDDDQPVVLALRDVPVVGDREDVEGRLRVVGAEVCRRRLAVGVRRVSVELTAQPDAVVAEERARHGFRTSGAAR